MSAARRLEGLHALTRGYGVMDLRQTAINVSSVIGHEQHGVAEPLGLARHVLPLGSQGGVPDTDPKRNGFTPQWLSPQRQELVGGDLLAS
jgi:hypothetical protein